MKIGILTFHRAHNYGAMLQAYATKTFLCSKGYGDVRIVDYEPEKHKYGYAVFDKQTFSNLNFLQKIKFLIRKNPLWMLRKQYRRKVFIEFCETYLTPFWNKEEQLDVLIYGSDQIWNVDERKTLKELDLCYFGDDTFHVCRKIAYSASMGIVKPTQMLDNIIRTCMMNFQAVSVREAALRDYIQRVVPDMDIHVTVDPVFLLTKDQWNQLVPEEKPMEKYILVYNLRGEPAVDELAHRMQLKTGYTVKRLTFDVNMRPQKEYLDLADPQTFLWLIKHAECVVASSFHGIAFSIIFHTPFYASLPGHALRIKSLLETAGLEKRWFDDPTQLDETPIDWLRVDENMEKMVKYSKEYLMTEIEKLDY